MRRELPGVPEEVIEHNPQQRRVALGHNALGDPPLHLAVWLGLLELLRDGPGKGGEIHRLAAHLGTRDARQFENVINQVAHALAGATNALEVILTGLIQPIGIVLQHGLAEAIDAPERGAQVVRDRVAERLQLLVRGPQLRGLLAEILVEPRDLLLVALALADLRLETLDGALEFGRPRRDALLQLDVQGMERILRCPALGDVDPVPITYLTSPSWSALLDQEMRRHSPLRLRQ